MTLISAQSNISVYYPTSPLPASDTGSCHADEALLKAAFYIICITIGAMIVYGTRSRIKRQLVSCESILSCTHTNVQMIYTGTDVQIM